MGDARVRLVSIRDCVADPSEVHELNHFGRAVYYRLAQRIIDPPPLTPSLKRRGDSPTQFPPPLAGGG